jgi:hypothetical protein
MTDQRKRIGPLNTAMSVAVENAKVYKELRRGRLEPSLASRLSQILMNQRTIIEVGTIETKLAELEAALKGDDDNTVVPFKKRGRACYISGSWGLNPLLSKDCCPSMAKLR